MNFDLTQLGASPFKKNVDIRRIIYETVWFQNDGQILQEDTSRFGNKTKYSLDCLTHFSSRASWKHYTGEMEGHSGRYLIVLYLDCFIILDIYDDYVYIDKVLYLNYENVVLLQGELALHKKTLEKSRIGLLMKDTYEFYIKNFELPKFTLENLDLSYGKGFSAKHEKILRVLNGDSSTIMFFHGPPGTGKSFYIKHLATVCDKQIIYIPISLVGSLTDPSFISLLADNKGSVLIIEDAEKALESRDLQSGNGSLVSELLNLSDGLLGSLLNIKIIATYNGDKEKIDRALLRKGRLSVDHEFRNLTSEEATAFAKSIGKNITFTKDTPLSDIYNYEDDNGIVIKESPVIGFGRKN